MSLGMMRGTLEDPTQTIDSLEQAHAEGHRNIFLGWTAEARQSRMVQSRPQRLITDILVSRCSNTWNEKDAGAESGSPPTCAVQCCTGVLTSAVQLQPLPTFIYLYIHANYLPTTVCKLWLVDGPGGKFLHNERRMSRTEGWTAMGGAEMTLHIRAHLYKRTGNVLKCNLLVQTRLQFINCTCVWKFLLCKNIFLKIMGNNMF